LGEAPRLNLFYKIGAGVYFKLRYNIDIMEFITAGAGETHQLAGKILKEVSGRRFQGALVLALEGELGAGKTVFAQGLGKAIGVKEKILSPTFVIMRHFNIKTFKHFSDLYYLDCYRLESAKDLNFFNFKEILKDKNNLVVIEWAERVTDILPKDAVWIKFEHGGGNKRRVKIRI